MAGLRIREWTSTDALAWKRRPEVTPQHWLVANRAGDLLAGDAWVQRYAADEGSIDVLEVDGCPVEGFRSYASIGASARVLPGRVRPPLGVEILAASGPGVDRFGYVVAAAALEILLSDGPWRPGVVISDLVARYFPDTTVAHLLFVPPYLWDVDFSPQPLGDRTVAWLYALPISDAEREYVRRLGDSEPLEEEFEAAQIDVFDLYRPSVR